MGNHVLNEIEIVNRQLNELSATYHSIAGTHKMSLNEFWVWYTLLILKKEYTQQDICEIWSLPKQTVHSIVSNLVKKGYATLEPAEGKKKQKFICLTENGNEFGKDVVLRVYEAEKRAFSRLSEEERCQFIAITEKYIRLFKEELHDDGAK